MLRVLTVILITISTFLISNEPKECPKSIAIILIGPPAAGKGSQAQLIREKLSTIGITLGHISTGDLLRENIKQGTPIGMQSKSLMEKGQLVPDSLIFALLFERIDQSDCVQGYILDGFPRTLAQAQTFEEKAAARYQLFVFHLDISDKEILERVTKRLTCEKCQRPYHLTLSPPKEEGLCDICGAKLYQRSDDNEQAVQKRLKVYQEQTKPLVEHFQQLGVLHTIDSSTSKETAFTQIMQVILENSPLLGTGEGSSS